VLVEAVCGGGEGLEVGTPLYIENAHGNNSAEAQWIFLWRF
jgi:hypothetical protein